MGAGSAGKTYEKRFKSADLTNKIGGKRGICADYA